ncbi:MAG TPA: protein-glutamate O-methyltransferase CheR [Gemmatimonadaceae bacterium]|nr:protein-glutamate O-methyltransferase CheR [Gemmatimonadaceae bacterium]
MTPHRDRPRSVDAKLVAGAGPAAGASRPPMPAPPQFDDEAGFLALTAKVSRERGFGCASYKEKCLRRRIAVRMRATGVHSYADYARVLDADAREYEKLLDALTINVTKLFRNWETYDAVARQVVPRLWQLPGDSIRAWSAGCSSGEEPYSIASLFVRHAESVGQRARINRVRVLGSDIDRASLEAARRGTYEEGAFADTPRDLRERFFTPGYPASVVPEVRSLVTFERRDLLAESPPPGGHHLVTCRNVVIYFDRATQEALFERFHEALLPGGFLVLGKVETLLGRARTLFAPVDARERIFQKL